MSASPSDTTINCTPLTGFIPAATLLNFDGVQVVTSAPAYPGDTEIQVVPLVSAIATGVQATYTAQHLHLPYIQVSTLTAVGVGRATMLSTPVVFVAITSPLIVAVGVGSASVNGGATEPPTPSTVAWNSITPLQWNSLTLEQWNNMEAESTTVTPPPSVVAWNSMTAEQWASITDEQWAAMS